MPFLYTSNVIRWEFQIERAFYFMRLPAFLSRDRDRVLTFSLLLLVCVGVIFWQARTFSFVSYDDKELIYGNPYYANPRFADLIYFWKNAYINLYIPVTYSFWGVAAMVARTRTESGESVLDPTVFHSLNIALHIGNSLLIFALLRQLVQLFKSEARKSDSRAITNVCGFRQDCAVLAGALIFALHPIQVESVVWATEAKGLLCAFFSFSALLLYTNWIASPQANEKALSSRASLVAWVGASMCFVLALLSKPTAAPVPLIACVIGVVAGRRPLSRVLQELSLWFIFSLIAVLVTRHVQPMTVGSFVAPVWQRPFVACDAISFYLGKLLAPFNLTIIYGRSPEWLLGQKWWILTPTIPAAIVYGVVRLRRPWLMVSLVIMLAAMVPNLGLTPFLFQRVSTVADRYFYMAIVGPCLVVAMSLFALETRQKLQKLAWLTYIVTIIACGYLTSRQINVWKNDENLFRHSTSVNSRDWDSMGQLAYMLMKQGKFEEAALWGEKARVLAPSWQLNLKVLARVRLQLKQVNEAISLARTAVQINPDDAVAHGILGEALSKIGDKEGSLREYRQVTLLNPQNGYSLFYMVKLLLQLNRLEEAEHIAKAIQERSPEDRKTLLAVSAVWAAKNAVVSTADKSIILKLEPKSAAVWGELGLLMLKHGKREEARALLKEASLLDPDNKTWQRSIHR